MFVNKDIRRNNHTQLSNITSTNPFQIIGGPVVQNKKINIGNDDEICEQVEMCHLKITRKASNVKFQQNYDDQYEVNEIEVTEK